MKLDQELAIRGLQRQRMMEYQEQLEDFYYLEEEVLMLKRVSLTVLGDREVPMQCLQLSATK